MMIHLKLVLAIIVALCATEASITPQPTALFSRMNRLYQEVTSALNKLTPNEKAEKTSSIVESNLKRFAKTQSYATLDAGSKKALAALADRSNCGESRLDVVDTIIEKFTPWRSKSTKWLNDATNEYARRCLTPDYIRDKVNSEISRFEPMKVVQFLDHQFFVDYESENPEKHSRQIMYGSILEGEFLEALAKAVIRDLKEDFKELKNYTDVYDYLKERLFEPCSILNQASKEVLMPLIRVRSRIEGYEKIILSLDENAREQIFRSGFCGEFYSLYRSGESVSRIVLGRLKSASA